MRIVVSLFIIVLMLFLGFLLFVEPFEVFTDAPRDELIANLSFDVSRLVRKGNLSPEDRETVFYVLDSFRRNPPLKTIDEMRKDDTRTKEPMEITIEEYKKKLVKVLEEVLACSNDENCPPSVVTPDSAHDLYRLTLLKEIFEKAHMKSKALDVLSDRVTAGLWTTTKA